MVMDTGIDVQKINLIIYIRSRVPKYFVSSDAARLQFETRSTNALAYSLSDLGCADISMALKMAHDFLRANTSSENVVIAYGCKSSTKSRFRYPVTINGAAGMAILVSRTKKNGFVDFNFKINGRYWDLFHIDFRNKLYEDYEETCTDQRKYYFELALESRDHFKRLQEKLFARNSLSVGDINHYILQNISFRAYEYYETAFDISISPVCKQNLEKFGHLGSGDVMLNLLAGTEGKKFHTGEKILILNNSPAAAWSCILIEV